MNDSFRTGGTARPRAPTGPPMATGRRDDLTAG